MSGAFDPGPGMAVVTGARRGIGAAIALELARRGHDLALTDVSEEGADAVLDAVRGLGRRACFVASDLADVASHANTVKRIVEWGGPIAVLVNNAGVGAPRRGDLLEVEPEDFDRVMGVNLRGTFFFTQAVARHMAGAACAAPRSIVTVSSVSVEMASIERADYCLSKAGLGMLTQLLALRMAPLDVSVYEVRPGIIRTPMTEGVATRYDQRIAEGLVPAARWGQPEDVARAVAALAGGDFRFATGSVVHVDGGLAVPRL